MTEYKRILDEILPGITDEEQAILSGKAWGYYFKMREATYDVEQKVIILNRRINHARN